MFTPTRDESRHFLIEAWAKYKADASLTALERIAAGIVAIHPEYHPALELPDEHAGRNYHAESGEINPYLHLSLHLAVAEQIAIDQPPGLREQYERLKLARNDEHRALHAVLECLGEVIWHAQRHGVSPDATLYLACLERQQ